MNARSLPSQCTMDNSISFVVDQWEFRERVSRGGLGDAFRLRRQDHAVPLLGLVLPPLPAERQPHLRAIHALAKRIAQLRHPAFLPLHALGTTQWPLDRSWRTYLVTAWFEADHTLDALAAGGPGDPTAAAVALQNLLQGLAELERLGVHHGEIAPDNVVIDATGCRLLHPVHARIIDECAAQVTSGMSSWDFTFEAPEVVRNAGAPDIPADIFSLAAVAYFALTGQKPFDSNSIFGLDDDLIGKVRPPDPREQCPSLEPNLGLVLACGLCFDRAQRYRRVADMLLDLTAVRQGRPPPYAGRVFANLPAWRDADPGAQVVSAGRTRTSEQRTLAVTDSRSVRTKTAEHGALAVEVARPGRARTSEQRAMTALIDHAAAVPRHGHQRSARRFSRRAIYLGLVVGLLTAAAVVAAVVIWFPPAA